MPSTLHPTHQKAARRHEMREDAVVTMYARFLGFYEKNRQALYVALGAVVLLAVAAVGYYFYNQHRNEKAQELLAGIVGTYEQGNYNAALTGSKGQLGLVTIADDYGSTDAGNLAHFYAADAYFRTGQLDKALQHFQAYDKEEDLGGASALAGEAAVYETRKDFKRAGELYMRAADLYESELTSPQYLVSAGRAYEAASDWDNARKAYTAIRERFPKSGLAEGVDFFLARLDAKAGVKS